MILSGQPALERYPATLTHLLFSMWFLNCPKGMKAFWKKFWVCKKLQHNFQHSCKKTGQNWVHFKIQAISWAGLSLQPCPVENHEIFISKTQFYAELSVSQESFLSVSKNLWILEPQRGWAQCQNNALVSFSNYNW